MDLRNIDKGIIYKNYKELCEAINEPVKGGSSKEYQLKKWERYFDFEKEGRKFIIKNIYDKPKPKQVTKMTYVKIIETLILDLLAQDDYETLFLSKNSLLKKLAMINQNYISQKYTKGKLSKRTEISMNEINEFYSLSEKMFKRNIEQALNNLVNKALIDWSDMQMVCRIKPSVPMNEFNNIKITKIDHITEDGDFTTEFENPEVKNRMEYSPATDKEIKLIMRIKNDLLRYYNERLKSINNDLTDRITTIQDLYTYGLSQEYFKTLNEKLFDKANIYYTYRGYKIVFNQDHIAEEYRRVYNKLKPIELYFTQKILNKEIISKINGNIDKRYNREIKNEKGFDIERLEKYKYRRDEHYQENGYLLTKLLIDIDSKTDEDIIKLIK